MDTDQAIERYRHARQAIRRAIHCYEQQELALFRQLVKEIDAVRNTYPDSLGDEPARTLAREAQTQESPAEDNTAFLAQENTHWCPPDFPNSRRPQGL